MEWYIEIWRDIHDRNRTHGWWVGWLERRSARWWWGCCGCGGFNWKKKKKTNVGLDGRLNGLFIMVFCISTPIHVSGNFILGIGFCKKKKQYFQLYSSNVRYINHYTDHEISERIYTITYRRNNIYTKGNLKILKYLWFCGSKLVFRRNEMSLFLYVIIVWWVEAYSGNLHYILDPKWKKITMY